ncbi:glutenin, low molecular weight subunit-like [Nematostella vectensis]|uniref:glutenin, low molecular weight subunit-like n=1 Tax=Nematostella vectensis TaxID=45351 RepID=UPI00138FE3AF|nr:glutenin, low molecular weight subunit-like [Nematostella vectensis]
MHNLQDHQLFRLSACRQSLTLGHSQHQPQARFSYNQQATTAFPNHPQGTCFTQPHAVNFQQQEHAIGYTLPGQLARFPQPVFKELEQAVDFQQQFYQTGTVLQHEVAGFLGRFEMEEQAARFKQQGQAARFIQQEQGARFIQQEQAPRFIQQEQGARFKQQEQGARFIQQEHGTRFIQQEQGARLKQQEQAARLKQQEQGARFKQQEQAPRLKQHYAVQDPTFETFSREHPPSIFHPPILSPPPCADPSMHYHQYDSVEYAISILENMSKHSREY